MSFMVTERVMRLTSADVRYLLATCLISRDSVTGQLSRSSISSIYSSTLTEDMRSSMSQHEVELTLCHPEQAEHIPVCSSFRVRVANFVYVLPSFIVILLGTVELVVRGEALEGAKERARCFRKASIDTSGSVGLRLSLNSVRRSPLGRRL